MTDKTLTRLIVIVSIFIFIIWWRKQRKNKPEMKQTHNKATSAVEPPHPATKNFKASDVIPPFPNQNPSADTPIDPSVCPVAPDCGSEPLKEEQPKSVAPNRAAPGNHKRRN